MRDAPPRAVSPSHEVPRDTLVVLGASIALLVYCFWNSFTLLTDYWNSPSYSHGWLVPAFAAALLWLRWDPSVIRPLDSVPNRERWWGVGLLAAGLLLRLVGAMAGSDKPDMWAFVPCLAGVVLLVGGWRLFAWTGPVIVFLVFMFPLPDRLEYRLLPFLQRIAAGGAEFAFQTFGYPVLREGQTFVVGERRLDVAEACSGLRMLTVFTAMTAALAIIMERPFWERALIFVSAVPIALVTNIIRITATALAQYHGGDVWMKRFHDEMTASIYMMAIAAGMLWLLVFVLGKLLVDPPPPTAHPVRGHGRSSGRSSRSDSYKVPGQQTPTRVK